MFVFVFRLTATLMGLAVPQGKAVAKSKRNRKKGQNANTRGGGGTNAARGEDERRDERIAHSTASVLLLLNVAFRFFAPYAAG